MNTVQRNRFLSQINWPQTMVNASRSNDKKRGRLYTSNLYISSESIREKMLLQEGKCCYCEVLMMSGDGVDRNIVKTAVTLERKDNNVEHLVSNCVLACLNCNMIRGNRFSFEEMAIYGKIKSSHKFCSLCKELVQRSNFHRDSLKNDGIENRCKNCQKLRRNFVRIII